ncbi:hypothetical protein AHAS_Ahas12G0090200 [Arachis hypogaea]
MSSRSFMRTKILTLTALMYWMRSLESQDGQAVPKPSPVIDDYIPEFPPVGLDISIESLSTRSFDPFTIEPIGTSAAAFGQPSAVEQISPSGTTSVDDSSDSSP